MSCTLKFPVLNMIQTRHIQCSNPTAILEFVKNLPDDNSTFSFIVEDLITIDDPVKCGRYLTSLCEAYQLISEERKVRSDQSINEQRDIYLMLEGESAEDIRKSSIPYSDKVEKLISIGVPLYAAYKFLGPNYNDVKSAISHGKDVSNRSYNMARTNPWIAKATPKDIGYFQRLAHKAYSFGTDSRGQPTQDDKDYNSKIGKFLKKAGIVSLIAVGLTAAVAGLAVAYKNTFSEAAKQCRGMFGKNRTICMLKAQIVACDRAISEAKKAVLECHKAKSEQDCQYKMKQEIYNWTRKKQHYVEKLNKLNNVKSSAFQ